MSVSFKIDIERVQAVSVVADALAKFFGLSIDRETPNALAATINLLTPKKLLQRVRQATMPTHVRYIAVIDKRTTDICRQLDDTIWKIGNVSIKEPPLHFFCRSSLGYFRP